MSKPSIPALAAVVLVVLSGCSAIMGPASEEIGQHRFVVENGHPEAQNVTATIAVRGEGPVVNETRRLAPDEQWVVATLNTSALTDGYTMRASTARASASHETPNGGPGATVIFIGEGRISTCEGNATCYNETA
ncbi:hypothetical protein ABSL23_00485 (plasmid) [Halobacterium sp. NMX12-1]|uniref:Lipoprotein n=1 Tax=Halobacterium sp. NMX12-1 TaxID=3166650 RepID=A0AAU8C8L5_9EURY